MNIDQTLSQHDREHALFNTSPESARNEPTSDDAMRRDLHVFLRDVANNSFKVSVLKFFLSQPGACVGTAQLAERLNLPHQELRDAVQELAWQGAVTFCPYFGRGDLCLMNAKYQTETMRRDLQLFQSAMRGAPAELESFHNA